MTIATATTNILSNGFSITKWISDLLLPADEAEDSQSVESIIEVVSGWNAGEVADAIGSIIGEVCIDRYGEADMEAARLFSESKVIRRSIGLRRHSRLYTQRSLGRSGPALKALREAIRIAEGVIMQRAMFSAQLDRYHENLEDDLLIPSVLDDEELEPAETAGMDYACVTTSSTDRRAKVRQNEIAT